jgi:hypothetical protein
MAVMIASKPHNQGGVMSEIWTTDCKRCAGTGEQPCNPCDKKHLNPECGGDCTCPTCNKGKMALWVYEELDNDAMLMVDEGTYRPLTVDEVEEVEVVYEIAEGYMGSMKARDEGVDKVLEGYLITSDNPLTQLAYKGQSVKLMPAEGV